MDDLLGEDWKSSLKSQTTNSVPSVSAFASTYSSLRTTPQPATAIISRSSTPMSLNRPSSTVNGGRQKNDDQFGNLLSLKTQSQKADSILSIQARQEKLLEEKRRQQEQHAQLWDTLGSGRGTPELNHNSNVRKVPEEEEEDILAAFNKDVPVDNASHYPPPISAARNDKHAFAAHQAFSVPPQSSADFEDDDDPFDLKSLPHARNQNAVASNAILSGMDDDNILGDLGKPVNATPSRSEQFPVGDFVKTEGSKTHREIEEPLDRAVAELVDMGFPVETSKIALMENTGDVQRAVGWLLQQAHEESKQKAQKAKGEARIRRQSPQAESRSPHRRQPAQEAMPAWMREEGRSHSQSRRRDNVSPANGERDSTQVVSDIGSKLFKSANSLWKASQKQMARTVAEFQQDRDPAQPKWLQGDSGDSSRSNSQRPPEAQPAVTRQADSRTSLVTDEAALLDMPREDRPSKITRMPANERFTETPARGRSPNEPVSHRRAPQPIVLQQVAQQDKRPSAKLTRQDIEEQSAQAYVSPARRRKTTPKPEPPPEPEVDLFSPATAPPISAIRPAAASFQTKQAQSISQSFSVPPTQTRSNPPQRSVPAASPTALATSAQHRKAGGEAFKRGDYAAAHEQYTAALSPLPNTHPIMIIILSNRSLTALKTGDAKTAVSDADRALEVIGAGQGVGESIDLGPVDGVKDMRDFYGKAMLRKAEALEHMEKWTDAAVVWRQAIAAGIGGPICLRGRDRCEKAAAPKPVAPVRTNSAVPTKLPPGKGPVNRVQRTPQSSASSTTAVKALRAANAAAEKADDEKFALTDQVDARLIAWKGGKADNLRALLQSLDGVLWAEAGWKKVGMSDLVMPNKVKIIYMKAIAKVHPDKIPQTATTEQRMISAAVFATLNEAWDKFKRDNNL